MIEVCLSRVPCIEDPVGRLGSGHRESQLGGIEDLSARSAQWKLIRRTKNVEGPVAPFAKVPLCPVPAPHLSVVKGDNLDPAPRQGSNKHAINPNDHKPTSIPIRQRLVGPLFASREVGGSLILKRAQNYGIHTLSSLGFLQYPNRLIPTAVNADRWWPSPVCRWRRCVRVRR